MSSEEIKDKCDKDKGTVLNISKILTANALEKFQYVMRSGSEQYFEDPIEILKRWYSSGIRIVSLASTHYSESCCEFEKYILRKGNEFGLESLCLDVNARAQKQIDSYYTTKNPQALKKIKSDEKKYAILEVFRSFCLNFRIEYLDQENLNMIDHTLSLIEIAAQINIPAVAITPKESDIIKRLNSMINIIPKNKNVICCLDPIDADYIAGCGKRDHNLAIRTIVQLSNDTLIGKLEAAMMSFPPMPPGYSSAIDFSKHPDIKSILSMALNCDAVVYHAQNSPLRAV